MKPKILVIIPAYNEAKVIRTVIAKIKNLNQGYDIAVINDGSKDNTAMVASGEGVILIDLPHNLGIGGAMQTGYLFAYKNYYDIAVQVDADGQHNPKEIPSLLEPIQKGNANLVVGSRYLTKTKYKSSLLRRIGMIIFSIVVSIISRQKFTDTTSGYRAVDRNVMAYFVNYYPTDYPEVEVLVLLKKAGFSIEEVSVTMEARQAGRSSITPFKSIYYMVKVLLALLINLLRTENKEDIFRHA